MIKEQDGLTESLFERWCSYYKNNPKFAQHREQLQKLHEDVFKRQRVTDISFKDDLPEKLTKELYIQIFRKIWATLRHELYNDIQSTLKQERITKLSKEAFDKLYTKHHKDFERTRVAVYELMMRRDQEYQGEAREMMQKAYATYSTLASSNLNQPDGEGETVRSRWADLVGETAAKHGTYIEQMADGIFYSGIEKNPLDSVEPDEKTDIKSLPGYQQRQKTFLGDDGRNVQPIDKKVDKYVNKFLEKAREKRAEKEKEQQEAKSANEKLA